MDKQSRTHPRLPVLGLPLEDATSSTSRAGFQRTVSETTETVRNQCGPAGEVGGLVLKKVPPLYATWVRRYWRLKIAQDGRQLSNQSFKIGYLRDQGPQDTGVWAFLCRPDLPYKMAPDLGPRIFSAPITRLTPLPDRGCTTVSPFESPVEFGLVLWELQAFKVSQNGGRTVKNVF
ncbi:hypothetical protein ACJJTC_005500 [Scirpophaga incertulas]